MKYLRYAAVVGLAVAIASPFSAFAQAPRSDAANNRAAFAARTDGHTDPELARLIGIEPNYVFRNDSPSSTMLPTQSPAASGR